jgi:hypothetical protein
MRQTARWASPVLADQQFAVGRALVGSGILQEGMQRHMKEQRCSKRRPHDATAESNPNRVWEQALKDDRGTGALSAAEPSPGYAPPAGGKRPAPDALASADERFMPARVPERIPTSIHEQVREPTP